MLIIRKNQLNKLVVTASQNRSLPNPYYLFAFTHILSREEVNFVGYIVSSNTRYDQFELIESPFEDLSLTPPLVTFPYLGQYYYEIYEQNSSTNTDPSLATNEVENGRAYVIVKNDNETECLYEQYISPNETNQNIIFISESEEVCLTPEPTPSMTATVSPTAQVTPSMTPTFTQTPTTSQVFYYYDILLCSGGPGASNKIRSSVPIAIGSSVTLAANPTCYEVISLTDASGVWILNFNNYDNCASCLGIPQTPTNTPTNTGTPTNTPTMTPTPSATCPITTQYLEVELSENTKFKLILWNQPDFTSPANALCDYVISGVAYGDMGTIYYGQETILAGQHQHQFNLAPVLQEGEIVQGFAVLSVNTNGCSCPVNLIYPESLWVAGGNGINKLGYSYDGLNWSGSSDTSSIITQSDEEVLSIQYNGNMWVAGIFSPTITSNRFVYSYDAITWSASTNGNSIFTSSIRELYWNGNMWVAAGNGTNTLGYSYDGITWSASTNGNSIISSTARDVVWNGSMWVAAGAGTNTLAYSYDGITWSASTNGNSVNNNRLNTITYNGSIFVAGGLNTPNNLVYSTDGLIWSASTNGNSIFTTNCLNVAWDGSKFIAGGAGTNTLAYSYDGITWSASTNGNSVFSSSVNKIAWNGSLLVSSGSNNKLGYSYDGLIWSASTNGDSIFTTSCVGLASKPAPELFPPIL